MTAGFRQLDHLCDGFRHPGERRDLTVPLIERAETRPLDFVNLNQRAVITIGSPSVMATVCSLWAVREPSALRIVQPSSSIRI